MCGRESLKSCRPGKKNKNKNSFIILYLVGYTILDLNSDHDLFFWRVIYWFVLVWVYYSLSGCMYQENISIGSGIRIQSLVLEYTTESTKKSVYKANWIGFSNFFAHIWCFFKVPSPHIECAPKIHKEMAIFWLKLKQSLECPLFGWNDIAYPFANSFATNYYQWNQGKQREK